MQPAIHPDGDATLAAHRLRVRYSFGTPRVLKDVSLQVYPGEIVCIIGPNGAGKTTLLNILAGCFIKTRCKIEVFGMNRWRENYAIRQRSTYVPAIFGSAIGQTPLDHLKAIGVLYRMEPEPFAARCAELVNDLNFGPYLEQPWRTLSLGLRHKGMLIGGFLPPADLRILDEPVASGIDPLGMEILGVWMKEAKSRGESIIFSTQVLDRAHLLADRLFILANGKAAFWGTPQELIQRQGLNVDDDYALNRAFFQLFSGDES